MKSEKIGFIEAVSLITIVIINKVILVLPQNIISLTGSGAWLNAIYVSIIALLITWLITALFKHFQGKNIFEISSFLGGNFLKIIIEILYLITLLIVPIYVLKNISESLITIYFNTSPLLYILLFFIISSVVANHFNLKTISKANTVLMFASFLGIAAIIILSAKHFSFDRLFPILGYGPRKIFVTGLESLFSFSAIGYLFLINPLLDKTKKFKKISIISIAISGIYLVLTVTSILLSFSLSLKGGESFSLYLLSRNVEFGRFVQRIDAVFILFWIISIILYISIALNFAINIFKKITHIVDTKYVNYSMHMLILAILLIPCTLAKFNGIVENIFKYLVFIVLYFASILILILANIKLRFLNKRKDLKKQ